MSTNANRRATPPPSDDADRAWREQFVQSRMDERARRIQMEDAITEREVRLDAVDEGPVVRFDRMPDQLDGARIDGDGNEMNWSRATPVETFSAKTAAKFLAMSDDALFAASQSAEDKAAITAWVVDPSPEELARRKAEKVRMLRAHFQEIVSRGDR